MEPSPWIERFYAERKALFSGVVRNAHIIGNRIGRRETDDLRATASWLFMRACVTAQSIVQLFEPPPSGFGTAVYLDHGSLAVLCRALIENIAVQLYIGDTTISEDEWSCRKRLIDLHDFVNRRQFLKGISFKSSMKQPEKFEAELRNRVADNAFFKTLTPKRQKRLLDGDDMFIDGRHEAMLKLGWGEAITRAVYKYLSNQAHSLAMAFHRTEHNQVYAEGSDYPQVVASFAIEMATKALGVGCLRMIELFPDTELAFDAAVILAFKKAYNPEQWARGEEP